MDRTAVFVDAGYLFASGSRALSKTGGKLLRSQLHLDHEVVLELLARLVTELTGLPLLRIYWYDGASVGPNAAHIALAYRPSLKLRLGQVDARGQQQGVDALLISDLVTLAKNHACADALLLTGDDDIRPGVEQAQEHGVRVHLLGIPPARENQAAALVQAADSVRELTLDELRGFLSLAAKKQSAD
ncbi:MAG TPA: NYN domain-containing protein [Polyangiaceae bacterium]|nr:NYN domain-containing protein [Polyangiaceae bacterium]